MADTGRNTLETNDTGNNDSNDVFQQTFCSQYPFAKRESRGEPFGLFSTSGSSTWHALLLTDGHRKGCFGFRDARRSGNGFVSKQPRCQSQKNWNDLTLTCFFSRNWPENLRSKDTRSKPINATSASSERQQSSSDRPRNLGQRPLFKASSQFPATIPACPGLSGCALVVLGSLPKTVRHPTRSRSLMERLWLRCCCQGKKSCHRSKC